MSKIVAKVADIIDNRTLVLNKGKDSNVKENMVFQVFDKNGKSVVDPDTRKVIGNLKIPKIKVRVTYVDANYSLAETYKFKNVNVGGINSIGNVSRIMNPPKYIRKFETFDLDVETRAKIRREQSIVKVGDLAELSTDEGMNN